MTFALRSLHGAALFDSGRRPWGLQEMQQARSDLGAVSLTGEQAAALAVLEHRRPFATAEPPARALLDRQLHRSGTPDPFAHRALTTARQAGRTRPSHHRRTGGVDVPALCAVGGAEGGAAWDRASRGAGPDKRHRPQARASSHRTAVAVAFARGLLP